MASELPPGYRLFSGQQINAQIDANVQNGVTGPTGPTSTTPGPTGPTGVTGPGALSANVSLGGSPIAAFSSSQNNVAVTSATTAMTAVVSPGAYPGDGIGWDAFVVNAGNVSVVLRNSSNVSVTPATTTYQIRVIR